MSTNESEFPWNTNRINEQPSKGRIRAAIDSTLKTIGMRGTDPDAVYEGGQEDAYERGLRAGRRMMAQYRNGDGEGNWKTLALWALGALQGICIIILGYVYGSLSDLRLAQNLTHDDVTQIKCKLDPACRIVVSNEQHSTR